MHLKSLFAMDEFKKNLRESTGFRVFLYLFALLICSLIGGVVTMLLSVGTDVNLMKAAQGISSALIFIAPPLVLYGFTRVKPFQAVGFRRISNAWLLLIGVALMFVSLPVTGQLVTWNESLKLGPAFESIEFWMQQLEETANQLTEQMLQVDSFGGLLINLLVIALIPAL